MNPASPGLIHSSYFGVAFSGEFWCPILVWVWFRDDLEEGESLGVGYCLIIKLKRVLIVLKNHVSDKNGRMVCFLFEERLISPASQKEKEMCRLVQFANHCYHCCGFIISSIIMECYHAPNNPLYTNTVQVITRMCGSELSPTKWDTAKRHMTPLVRKKVGPESSRPIQWCSKTWHCCSFLFFLSGAGRSGAAPRRRELVAVYPPSFSLHLNPLIPPFFSLSLISLSPPTLSSLLPFSRRHFLLVSFWLLHTRLPPPLPIDTLCSPLFNPSYSLSLLPVVWSLFSHLPLWFFPLHLWQQLRLWQSIFEQTSMHRSRKHEWKLLYLFKFDRY